MLGVGVQSGFGTANGESVVVLGARVKARRPTHEATGFVRHFGTADVTATAEVACTGFVRHFATADTTAAAPTLSGEGTVE